MAPFFGILMSQGVVNISYENHGVEQSLTRFLMVSAFIHFIFFSPLLTKLQSSYPTTTCMISSSQKELLPPEDAQSIDVSSHDCTPQSLNEWRSWFLFVAWHCSYPMFQLSIRTINECLVKTLWWVINSNRSSCSTQNFEDQVILYRLNREPIMHG